MENTTDIEAVTGQAVIDDADQTNPPPSDETEASNTAPQPKRFKAKHAGLFRDPKRFEELKQAMAEARAAIEADPNRP